MRTSIQYVVLSLGFLFAPISSWAVSGFNSDDAEQFARSVTVAPEIQRVPKRAVPDNCEEAEAKHVKQTQDDQPHQDNARVSLQHMPQKILVRIQDYLDKSACRALRNTSREPRRQLFGENGQLSDAFLPFVDNITC